MKKVPKKQNKKSAAVDAKTTRLIAANATAPQSPAEPNCLYIFVQASFVQASKVLYICAGTEMRDAPLRVTDHWILDDKVYEVRAMPQFMVSNLDKGSVVPRLAAYVALRQDKPLPDNKMNNVQEFVRQLMTMMPANNSNPRRVVLVVVTALANLEIDPLLLGLDSALSGGFLLDPKQGGCDV